MKSYKLIHPMFLKHRMSFWYVFRFNLNGLLCLGTPIFQLQIVIFLLLITKLMAVAVWGRYDTKLTGLGFVQAKEISRGKKAEIPSNIVFDVSNNMIINDYEYSSMITITNQEIYRTFPDIFFIS